MSRRRKGQVAMLVGSLAAVLTLSATGITTLASKATNWSTATSAAAGGGMTALIKAAKKEGQLTVTTLPDNWANYGAIMHDFSKKYGIKITDENPEGSSQYEVDAMQQLAGTSREPDVLDMGPPFAVEADQDHLLAPYKVVEWNQIASDEKASDASWYYDYGGYVSIGYNAGVIKTPPTSFASLTNPEFKGGIGLNGNPTDAGAAFAAVFAAALANGGNFNNIMPGINFFKTLGEDGNFVPAQSTEATIASGQIHASLDWDYLNVEYAHQLKGTVDWKVIVPKDGKYAAYYCQAISKDAPHPAAARLWEEYLYSNVGQNLWLEGYARPVLLSQMIKTGTVNKQALAEIPPVSGDPTFPTLAQQAAQKQVVLQQWSTVP
ncbi:MAG: ABC transporter substrate-binding protein [Candidatus Dormiibacterota bacterium]|jgi:putative spermidine/putrescine transport system substrate-binding protein